MGEYYETQPGDMTTIEDAEMRKDMVCDMAVGVADIIGMPNSPEDLDENMESMVLFIEATTIDGEKHTLMFQERETYGLWQAIHEYRNLMLEREREKSKKAHPASGGRQGPDEVIEKLKMLFELLDRQDDEDS